MADLKSLDELLQAQYGFRSVPKTNPVTDTVETTVTKIVNGNPKRVYLNIINIGVSNVYILPFGDVSQTKGIFISPGGGAVTLEWRTDFHLLEHEWYAIAIGSPSEIFVLEGVMI